MSCMARVCELHLYLLNSVPTSRQQKSRNALSGVTAESDYRTPTRHCQDPFSIAPAGSKRSGDRPRPPTGREGPALGCRSPTEGVPEPRHCTCEEHLLLVTIRTPGRAHLKSLDWSVKVRCPHVGTGDATS